jgi:hypothetical protein
VARLASAESRRQFQPKCFPLAGSEVVLPNLGMETVHHVHATTSRQWAWHGGGGNRREFSRGVARRLTLRGYAEAWRVVRPGGPATLLGWEEWRHTVTEKDAAATWITSPIRQTAASRRRDPAGVRAGVQLARGRAESVQWLIEEGSVVRWPPASRHTFTCSSRVPEAAALFRGTIVEFTHIELSPPTLFGERPQPANL